MSSETIIRPARGDELAAVLTLWQKSGVTPASVTDSIDGLTRLIGEPGGIVLVTFIDGQIVGSVIGGWDGWRGNIYRLAVTPRYRRRGIARRLVAEISSALFAKGAVRLSALVEREHRWAIDFGNPCATSAASTIHASRDIQWTAGMVRRADPFACQ
jgi:ribosomal protein S18 acetylase RimI-like enzyme